MGDNRVTFYLVRHAKAYSRARWIEDNQLRPLTPAGHLQSEAIATAIEAEHPVRLISSPAVRCFQTLQPLAEQTSLRIELDPRLGEGADGCELEGGGVVRGACPHRPSTAARAPSGGLSSRGQKVPGPRTGCRGRPPSSAALTLAVRRRDGSLSSTWGAAPFTCSSPMRSQAESCTPSGASA